MVIPKKINFLIGIIITIYLIPIICLSGGSYIIGIQNLILDPNCEAPGFIIKNNIWLIIHASENLMVGILTVPFFISYITVARINHLIGIFIVHVIDYVYIFIFSTIGAVELFYYSNSCLNTDSAVWIMMLTDLIAMWLSLFKVIIFKKIIDQL